MDLRRLRLFLAVVDEGGFTRAADAMFVSQPSVSQAMRELEGELGTPLFHRVGRGVVLTSAGEALVGPARQVLRDVDVGEAAVASVTGLVTGRLDLCSLPTLAVDPVAPLVGAFRLAYPGVTLALADPDDSADLVHLVSTGACELGVDAQPAPGRLESRELASQDLLAVFPPGTPAPRGAIGIDRLAEFSLVTSPEGTSTRRLLDDACASAGVTPRITVVTEQREAILPLVLAGAGATLLARPLAETAQRLGAVIAPLRPPVSRSVFMLWRAGPLSPAAQAFIEIAGIEIAAV
jgi:LysR family carnitine catabolism transcriptional activator